jgi:hypothetical protein
MRSFWYPMDLNLIEREDRLSYTRTFCVPLMRCASNSSDRHLIESEDGLGYNRTFLISLMRCFSCPVVRNLIESEDSLSYNHSLCIPLLRCFSYPTDRNLTESEDRLGYNHIFHSGSIMPSPRSRSWPWALPHNNLMILLHAGLPAGPWNLILAHIRPYVAGQTRCFSYPMGRNPIEGEDSLNYNHTYCTPQEDVSHILRTEIL